MFCDLVGSTGISAQLDAEEWRDLVGAYLDAASAAVTEMGGHVAKKLGDGLMCAVRLSGGARERRRARGAGGARRSSARWPNSTARMPVPASQSSPPASASNPARRCSMRAGEIYGDVANIAARVQALAEPGAVLVTARVQRQVAGLFVAEERGTHTLKGRARADGAVPARSREWRRPPLRAAQSHAACRPGRRNRHADAALGAGASGRGPIGADRRRAGLGQIAPDRGISLPGCRDTPHTWVEWSCSQLLQNTPLHPIAEWGRQRFGGADVPAERRLADLENSLAQVKLDPAENASLARAAARYSAAQGTRIDVGARGIAPPATGGADQLGDGRRQGAAGGAGVRGFALGRSDHARCVARHCRARRAGAALHRGDDPARVSPALGHALASRHDFAGAARPRPGARHGRRAFRPPRAVARGGRGRRRAHRRRAAVRRGGDAAPAWSAANRAAPRPSRRRCNNR